ncbi:signal peptide peptidase SppA [Phytoactinopolyspora limicola]|uniref:signal peptide peptidase SppA n=1 Tax=Phytoactinopolyspora limicola TaxID=2715536 RepID=UPI0014085DCD|nr:signal peptide peptidase SppA [Phytoactinopolyspora limicola]
MSAAPLVLELELHTPLTTAPPQDPLSAFRARHRTHLTDVIEGLRRAATDPDVAGLVAQCDGGSQPATVIQELRDAVRTFRRAGKPAVAWAQSFGELAPGTIGYYLATAFDDIWLQPSGTVGLTGLNARAVFLREALDRLGMQPNVSQRHEYKNAADMFTRSEFSDAHREALGRIVESTAEQVVEGIADGRSLTTDQIRELIDAGPLSAQAALDAGLVDHIGYRDEVYTSLTRRAGGRMRLRYVGRYNHGHTKNQALLAPIQRQRGTIAVIHGRGAVTVGRSSAGPFTESTMGADTVSGHLRAATRDTSVKAIVFRVDSPGGSYVASDTIRREVHLARRTKPVIASMGAVAGSGGYFVTMGADVIVAAPATITGSIGVLAGKLVTKDLLSRIGIHTDAVKVGDHAGMFTPDAPFTDDQWDIVNQWLDDVYADFTTKVAEDRGMTQAQVHEVARGRIWTGADAHRNGLVDELGGLATAVRIARARGGLPSRDDLADVRPYPRIPLLERLRPADSSQSPAAASVSLRPWGQWTTLAALLGLPAAGPLTMPFPFSAALPR